jgi:hypothetical protein
MRAAAGLCLDCASPATEGRRRCAVCLVVSTGRVRRLRERRTAAGLCRYCETPAEPDRALCARHAEANRAQVAAYRARMTKDAAANPATEGTK